MRDLHRTTAIALVLLGALGGCVTVESTRLGEAGWHPPLSPDAVTVYLNASEVHRPYQQVALLDASGDYAMTSEEKMFSKLKKKAAALGANAIILNSVSEPGTGAKVADLLIGVPADRRGQAIAIYIER